MYTVMEIIIFFCLTTPLETDARLATEEKKLTHVETS